MLEPASGARPRWKRRTSSRRLALLPIAACIVLLHACQSSSDSHGSNAHDGGPNQGGAPRDATMEAADGATSCQLLGQPCPSGQTCCLSAHLRGICTDIQACSSNAQFQCSGSDDCDAGEHCCVTLIDGADPSATAVCATECAAPSRQTCRSTDDCPAGSRCEVLPEGASSSLVAFAAEAYKLLCSDPDGGTAP